MLNLSLLQRDLEISENPGLDTLDTRFQDIASLVQSNDLPAAAARSESLFNEKIYDIRLISYFLYGVFHEQGARVLGEIFQCLINIFNNWDAIGPSKRKEKHAKVSIKWLLSKLIKILQYQQDKGGYVWQKWLEETKNDEVESIIESSGNFRKILMTVLEDQASLEQLQKINTWLQEFHKIIYELESEKTEKVEKIEEKDTQLSETEASSSRDNDRPAQMTQVIRKQALLPSMEISYPLQLLIKKIDAFEILVRRGEFKKASIIADDINNEIENFNPRSYFPKIFGKYYTMLNHSINEIVDYYNEKDTPQWDSMVQFYMVDMDGFMEFDREQ